MEGDEIIADFSSIPEEEIPEPSNPILDEVLEKYDCDDLLPLANRIIWLSSVREAVGYIPEYIYDDEELEYLVVLEDERGKKLAKDNYLMKQESERMKSDANIDMENVARR